MDDRHHNERERERFFSLSLDMCCIAGFDGYFKSLNNVWEQVLGYSREEMLAQPFVEFIHPDDREPTAQLVQKMFEGEKAVEFENRYRNKKGEYRRLLWNGIAYMEEERIYATARDITDQKAAQEQFNRRLLAEERVHRCVLQMERFEDFEKVIHLMAEELKDMGLVFDAVGLNTIDENENTLTGYSIVR
jgi:PAS domain S-box-containing protein